MTDYKKPISDFRNTLLGEISYAFGFPRDGWQRKVLTPIFWLPVNKFSRIIAGFDHNVQEYGLSFAARSLIRPFVKSTQAFGLENIPSKGPLVIASNHPGAYDGFVITSYIPRNDLKIVVSGVPFLMNLPASREHLIYTSAHTQGRMRTVREILRHLKEGGALLTFPSGKIDPDPAISDCAEMALEAWSSSLALILRKVPETKILPTMVSGVLSSAWLRNPVARIQREKWRQQKLAEFFQIMQQIFFPNSIRLSPRVIFGEALDYDQLRNKAKEKQIMSEIITQAKKLYKPTGNAGC